MSLTDLIQECTSEVRATIQKNTDSIAKIESDRDTTKQAVDKQASEIQSQQAVVDERKRRTASLESEIKELRRKLEEKARQLSTEIEEVHEAEQTADKIRKEKNRALDATVSYEKQIHQLHSERENLDGRLEIGYRTALSRYIIDLNSAILHFATRQEDKKEKLIKLRQMNEARTRDKDIASLCDGRDELRRFLNSSSIPAVKEALAAQLRDIEQKLEKRFPGALEAESAGAKKSEDMQELFYMPVENGQRTRIFMPFDKSAWERLSSGEHGRREEIAVRVAWEIIGGLRLANGTSDFSLVSEIGVVSIDTPINDEIDDKLIEVPLGSDASVTFIFLPLPEVIQKALANADENK